MDIFISSGCATHPCATTSSFFTAKLDAARPEKTYRVKRNYHEIFNRGVLLGSRTAYCMYEKSQIYLQQSLCKFASSTLAASLKM
jgi:hypothetical protein